MTKKAWTILAMVSIAMNVLMALSVASVMSDLNFAGLTVETQKEIIKSQVNAIDQQERIIQDVREALSMAMEDAYGAARARREIAAEHARKEKAPKARSPEIP